MPIVDASVYVALVNTHEEHHSRSWSWFQGVQEKGDPIIAPAILLSEIAAALSRGTGDNELAKRVIANLKKAGVVEIIPVTLSLADLAATIAADHQIRVCDAIYVAAAKQFTEPLITLDQQQLERAASVVQTLEPSSRG
jgi:predicted nucleic acid-binding protein